MKLWDCSILVQDEVDFKEDTLENMTEYTYDNRPWYTYFVIKPIRWTLSAVDHDSACVFNLY